MEEGGRCGVHDPADCGSSGRRPLGRHPPQTTALSQRPPQGAAASLLGQFCCDDWAVVNLEELGEVLLLLVQRKQLMNLF